MSYPRELKIALVREYEQGKTVAEISKSRGIPENSIYRWIREYKTIVADSYSFTPSDYNKLQKHSKKADHVLEIIRLSGFISVLPLKKRLATAETIYRGHSEYSVHEICEALDIDRGTFYNHIFRRRDTSWRDEKEHRLMLTVQQVFDESGQRYGADRITKTMNAQGISINKQHVLSIMHELGLEAMSEGSKKTYKQKREQHANKVRRQFSVDRPNKVWVSDITYFNCCGKSMYICVVIDLYSRMVVGYSVSGKDSKQIVSSAIKKAIESRKPEKGLILHSDRGNQYVANSLNNLLKKHGIEQSFSASGKPYDNAVAEAFFSILKKEELYRYQYRSVHDFLESLDNYIEYYNKTRVHSFLRYLSPAQFEAKNSAKNDNS